jgi:opacity protein-like surface antigen
MIARSRYVFAVLAASLAIAPASAARADDAPAPASEPPASAPVSDERAPSAATPAPVVRTRDGLEALNPELALAPYRLAPGPRQFQNRISFSPGYGALGNEPMFVARVAYSPSPWLGYEWSLGHDPGRAAQAVLHMISAVVRHPLSGRFQPYATGGYGMMLVSTGLSTNAKPVTKNALTIGGGVEFYVRSDLALRGEARYATVFGRERDHDGVVVFDYLTETIGLAFYRSIRP